jgi:hypothetical protein
LEAPELSDEVEMARVVEADKFNIFELNVGDCVAFINHFELNGTIRFFRKLVNHPSPILVEQVFVKRGYYQHGASAFVARNFDDAVVAE